MMLSSTINTLIGGTAAFSIPAGRFGWSFERLLFLRCWGRGDDTRGGGVATRWICATSRGWTGGVGSGGGGGGAVLDFSEALD